MKDRRKDGRKEGRKEGRTVALLGHHSEILAILLMHFDYFFLLPKTFKLFGVPFFLTMYLMKVIPETYHVQLIRYLCFFIKIF